MTNRRKYVPFIYLGIIAATIIIIASMVGLANAYFTSTADKEGEINFHNVELQINSTNQNSALFSTASTLIPGESISFSNISVKNIGTTDIYSLINLNIYIQRVGYTASVTDLWYNLDGAGVNYKNISSNTTNATKLEVNASQNLNLSYEFRSCKYNNTFKNSSVKITLRAVGIQSANLQEVEEITSEPLIASYWLINDFHVDQPNNIVDLNQFETQTSLLCDETTEQTTISDQTHSVFNFKVDNTEPGDTVYVQASNADMVSIIPGTYDLNSIDLNNLPAGSVQAQGQTVTTFTVPEQTTYALSKSIVKIDNVLSDDWDKTFTVSAVTSVNSTKKPIVMVYTTPQDDFPDVVDGVLVYQIDYLDIKNGALTFETPLETMPLDEYTIMDVSNYIVSNITENSTVTVYAYNAKASFITMDNYSLQSILEYIGQDEMPPNLVSAGLNECIYTFPVSAGTSLKFCVFSINDPTAAPSLTPKVSVYVTPTGNLPMVVDDVAYQLLEDGTGYSAFAANMFAQTANILSTINGKPVKVIKDAGFSSSSISTVTIPATVTEIGDNAFEYCYVLGNVTFETNSQLTSIGDYAFSGCEALTEIEIPASVTEIEYGAFEYCYVLGNVTFEANSQLTSIGDYAFHHCLALTEIEIPASVTEIEYGAFYGCTNLEKVTFAANSQLTSIGDNAFNSCTNLEKVTFEANSQLTTIGGYAFSGCTALTEMEIPASVTEIKYTVFSACNNLSKLTLNAKEGYVWAIYNLYNSLVSLADGLTQSELITYAKGNYNFKQILNPNPNINGVKYAISSDGTHYSVVGVEDGTLTTYTIQSQIGGKPVQTIGVGAFSGCTELTEIEIPSSVTEIGYAGFTGCSKLTKVTFAANSQLTLIDAWAFYNCTALTEIEMPAGVTSIGSSALRSCTALTEIEIPASVTSIGELVFAGCSKLNKVTFAPNSQLTAISEDAFSGCTSLTKIEIPASVTTIGEDAFYNCTALNKIEIPSSVTEIGQDAFYRCTNLSRLTLNAKEGYVWSIYNGNNVLPEIADASTLTQEQLITYAKIGYKFKQILNNANRLTYELSGDGTYYSVTSAPTDVTFVYIPSTHNGKPVKKIGNYAFNNCTALTGIGIPASVTEIEHYAFENCTNLNSVTFGENSQLTTIGDYAFSGCTALTEMEIPASVTAIGDYAFSGCTNLSELTLNAKEGFVWAVYQGSGKALVEFVEGLTQAELLTYAKGSYNFKQILDSSDKLGYTLSADGTYYSVSAASTDLTFVYIPSTYNGKPVKKIMSYGFDNCTALTEIEISASVTEIGNNAFENCTNLSKVTFAANSQITSIGEHAFYGCTALTEIEIPAGVTSIGMYAFYGCTALTEIEIPAGVTSIECYTFYDCNSLTEIEIPASVTEIVSDAFGNCNNLSKLTLNAKTGFVWSIYNSNNNSSKIADASSLTQAELLTYTNGYYTFKQVKSVDGVEYSLSADGIGYSVVGVVNKELTTYSIKSQIDGISVNSIGGYVFKDCTALKDLDIPASVTSIGFGAFQNCTALTEIEIPAGVTSIGMYAFDGCNTLGKVTFEANSELTLIDACAFRDCTALTEIEIPASVTEIGWYAFSDCSNLVKVEFAANSQLTEIGQNVFANCTALTEIEIPASVTEIEYNAFGNCTNLSKVSFAANSKLILIDNGAFLYCSALTEIEIPASVTLISYEAFYGCTNFNKLTLNAKEGFVWAVYQGNGTTLVVEDASTLTQEELITYAKGYYNFKQVEKTN